MFYIYIIIKSNLCFKNGYKVFLLTTEHYTCAKIFICDYIICAGVSVVGPIVG